MSIQVFRSSLIVAALLVVARFTPLSLAGDRECSVVTAYGKLQMFERGTNGKLMHRTYDTDKKEWSDWAGIAITEISSSPSALMTSGDRLAVFFRGTDGKLYHVFRDKETGWSEVIGLGTRELTSGPTAALAGDQLTVYARGTSGKMMQIYYDKKQQSWTDWSDVE